MTLNSVKLRGFLKSFIFFRSLPKLSSHENEDEDRKKVVNYFEPTPHDHSLCERVVINVRLLKPKNKWIEIILVIRFQD